MLLSFIIPAFNSELYITRSIESIYNLSINHDDFEVIVINDGSTDSTKKILSIYASKYANFRFFTQDNQGAGAARNNGIMKASGDYIQFVDSDDFLINNRIESIVERLRKGDLDVLALDAQQYSDYSKGQYIYRNGYENNIPYQTMTGEEYILTHYFLASPCLYISSRKYLIDNKLFYLGGGKMLRRYRPYNKNDFLH